MHTDGDDIIITISQKVLNVIGLSAFPNKTNPYWHG